MKNLTLTPILLPTEDASKIPIFLYTPETHDVHHNVLNYGNYNSRLYGGELKLQHLHLCSTLPIKKEEWYLDSFLNELRKCQVEVLMNNPKYFRVEFTTDPKLIADGVPVIDGNTKAEYWIGEEVLHSAIQVNFLEEYRERYNEKGNHKEVDVEKLELETKINLIIRKNEDEIMDELACEETTTEIMEALQSNAGGKWSDEDMKNFMDWFRTTKGIENIVSSVLVDKYIQFLTKQTPKGDIIIECEMEEYHWQEPNSLSGGGFQSAKSTFGIKLTNGQPTLIFK